MLDLIRYELGIRRGGIVGWGLALSIFVMIYTTAYPTLPPEMAQLDISNIEFYQAIGQLDMTTFEAYFASTVLNFLAVLLGIYGITQGTATLAGEEDSGTLELLAALPLARWQLVLAKALALGVGALATLGMIGLVGALIFLGIKSQVETSVTAAAFFLVILSGWPLAMTFMMAGLFLGAYLPTRRAAAGAGAALLVASFFGNNLATIVEELEPFRILSPFHYYATDATIFSTGLALGDVLALLTIAAGFLLLALLAFQRRNLTTGAWPWQRARLPG